MMNYGKNLILHVGKYVGVFIEEIHSNFNIKLKCVLCNSERLLRSLSG